MKHLTRMEHLNVDTSTMTKNVFIQSLLTAGVILAALSVVNFAFAAQQATVITLTQTACQFIESEGGVDHGYTTMTAEDCKAINAETGAGRLARSRVLELKPGKYIFRVTNKNVPYNLGFWLRGKGFGRLTLPSVSGGGLAAGTAKDYEIELKAGEYIYSCPLNPTPNYKLIVAQ